MSTRNRARTNRWSVDDENPGSIFHEIVVRLGVPVLFAPNGCSTQGGLYSAPRIPGGTAYLIYKNIKCVQFRITSRFGNTTLGQFLIWYTPS